MGARGASSSVGLPFESGERVRQRFGASVAGAAFVGIAPRFFPGAGGGLEWQLERSELFAPSVRLRADYAWASGLQEPGGVADFSLFVASLDLCPLRASLGRLALRPCATAAFGRLSAEGHATYMPHGRARPFARAALSAVLSYAFAEPFALELTAGIGRPLVRDKFAFGPGVFHRVSAVDAELGIGLGVRFP